MRAFFAAVALSAGALAQPADVPPVLEVAEVAPAIVGGLDSLVARVAYPPEAHAEGAEGMVVVQFVVDEAGDVLDPVAVRSPDPRLSEAAVAAVRAATFTPGRQGGVAVRVRHTVPVRFRLREVARAPTPRPAPRFIERIYETVEEMPVLVGGIERLQRRVVYPEVARVTGIEGQVVVQFVLDEEGLVHDPVAIRSPHPSLSAAAIAAVRASHFRPGRQQGRPVKVRYSIPVTFRLF